MHPRHIEHRSLTLTVSSDNPEGFEEMLKLALKELKRHAKLDVSAGDVKHGEANGTVGSYSFDFLIGDPELRKLIVQVEAEGYERAGGDSSSYHYVHEDGRNLQIRLDRPEIVQGERIDYSKPAEPYPVFTVNDPTRRRP